MEGFSAFADALVHRSALGNVVVLWRTDSTNSAARRIADEFAADEAQAPPVWVFAYQQARGRGRQGRNWASLPARGVYASLLVPALEPAALERLPLLAAIALSEEIEAITGRPCRVKWPNDLMSGQRKIGGILIESMVRAEQPAVAICGFGVNWSHTAAELPIDAATSITLEMAEAAVPPLGETAARLAGALARALDASANGGQVGELADRYRARSAHGEGDILRCSVGTGVVEGRFRGFDERGFLRLETPQGTRLLSAGEVIER